MMKPLYKQPLVEAVILATGILCTVVLIHGIQNFIALGGKPVTSHVAQKSNPDLVNVAASSGCPYSANVSLGQTAGGNEMRKNPTSDPKIYDPFEPTYTNQKSGTATPGVAKFPGDIDAKLPTIGTIFGYKPQSVNYYKVLEKDGTALTGTRWEQYLIGVPTEVGAEIRAPQTGYDIGGGKMGLVVYATGDQITIHVGRHEYLTGNGGSESGGYWIYLKGLCVNDQIVSQYNANAASRTQLPELAKGELLGYATGTEVFVAVRDDGPFMDILAPEWWTGVPAGSAAAAGVGPGGGAIVPAGNVSNDQISANIDLNGVQDAHKDLLRTTGDVAVAGDSTTDISPFPFLLEGKVPTKVAEGKQGANWLKGQIGSFPNNGRFALILIGVEEVQNGNVNAEMPNAGKLSEYESNLDAIVKGVLKKGTIPVLQEVNDFNSQPGMEANRKIVNDAMARVAKNNNVPHVKTPYITASHMKEEDGYHFNAAGAALRNQILGVVNAKLIALAASSAASAGKTVSGKIKLIGTGVNNITVAYVKDNQVAVKGIESKDGATWSFTTDQSNFCIYAVMWTNYDPVTSVRSEQKCGVKPGDKDIELTITAPAVAAPAAGKYTLTGHVILNGGELGTRAFEVTLYNDADPSIPVYNHWTHTLSEYGYSVPNLSAGNYTLKAVLYLSLANLSVLDNKIEKINLNGDTIRNITLNVPGGAVLQKYAITIKASKPISESCPTVTTDTLSAYCLLGKVFNQANGIVELTIKDKAPSNEQYRKYDTIETITTGVNKDVRSVDIYDVASANAITAATVQSAKVGDNVIMFNTAGLNIQVTP